MEWLVRLLYKKNLIYALANSMRPTFGRTIFLFLIMGDMNGDAAQNQRTPPGDQVTEWLLSGAAHRRGEGSPFFCNALWQDWKDSGSTLAYQNRRGVKAAGIVGGVPYFCYEKK